MADRWAFVIATDRFLDPELGSVPYAESGARAVTDALVTAGYPRGNHVLLLGQHATKAVIDSRVRKLARSLHKGDSVLVYFAGRAFSSGESGRLLAWDSLPDDLTGTSVDLRPLVEALTPASKVSGAVFLFDLATEPLPAAAKGDHSPGLDSLGELFEASPNAVGLVAAGADESSHATAALKASVWTYLLVEALAGRVAKIVDRDGLITAASLQDYLQDTIPRVLRKHFEAGVAQTPQLYGVANAGIVVADLSRLLGVMNGGFLLDPERLRRVVFRSDSPGRVKDLTSWRKTYELPDSPRPSARKFIARVAHADVKTDLGEVFEAAREHLGYKRKDLDVSTGPDGFGVLRTPDFEYTVTAALDTEDPTRVVWRREVGQFADAGFVRGPGFEAVFGQLFDQLVFEFAAPIDVEALVDRLEDRPPKGVRVQVASDGASCDITLTGFAGRVTVDRHSMTIRGRAGNSAGLLDQFLAFLRTVGPLGEPLALPPAH